MNAKRLARYMRNRLPVPAASIDDIYIDVRTVPKGTPMIVVSLRNAIFSGQTPSNIGFDTDIEIRSLCHNGGVWMRDDPQEVWQLDEVLRKISGKVLVGGLGLGVATHLISLKKSVKSVTTIEIDDRISQLVTPSIIESDKHSKHRFIGSDLFEYAQQLTAGSYDSAFLDIWQPTGEITWYKYIVPLRRLLRNKIKQNKIWCWQEIEMQGQIRNALPQVAFLNRVLGGCQAYYEVFRVTAQKLKLSKPTDKIDLSNMTRELSKFIDVYLNDVGTEKWENIFGKAWDELVGCAQPATIDD